MGAPFLLLLGGLWVHCACADFHSLRYFRSALSHPLPSLTQFTSLGFVDDVQITHYTSESGRAEPRAPWMRNISSYDPQYWDSETESLKVSEQIFKADVKIVMTRANQTWGLHIVQYMYGCELRADGSIGGFAQYGYDGRDFMSLNKDQLTYTAWMEQAKITQDHWSSDKTFIERRKAYLEGTCIKYLQQYLKNGEESMKRVRPELRVSRRMTGASPTLTCYVYGFYPREIEVKWVRNGVVMPWKSKQILPHPDGTYQAKMTVEVHEGDNERDYTCQVDHSSLEETVTVVYEDKSSPTQNIGLLAGMIVGVLLLLAAVIGGFLIWKKKRSAKGLYDKAQAEPDYYIALEPVSTLSTMFEPLPPKKRPDFAA